MPPDERLERNRVIAEEIEAYLSAIDQVAPYLDTVGYVPEGTEAIPKRPSLLDELERVEKWGLPNPGTWMDQPMEWFEDIEEARRARDLHPFKNPKPVDTRAIFAGAPAPRPLV